MQPDIAVFRQNLEALESLNSRWKLYQRVGIIKYKKTTLCGMYFVAIVTVSAVSYLQNSALSTHVNVEDKYHIHLQ